MEDICVPKDNVYGFFEMNFGDVSYGYCPQDNIPVEGHDILSLWFEQLTEVCYKLNKHPTVLLNEVDSYNS